MEVQIQAAIVGAVIGAFLAAGMGLLLDIYREWKKEKRIRDILVTAMSDDLSHTDGIYKEILEDWENHKIIFFHKLSALRDSRQTYYNNKDWIHIFSDAETRKKIFTYYHDSSICIDALERNQNRLHDIENKYNETLEHVKKEHSELSEQKQKDMALSIMGSSNQDYMNTKETTNSLVLRIANLKSSAKDLKDILKNL